MLVNFRLAAQQDMDFIYMMGFDVWSDGSTRDEYLLDCRNSPKYSKGTWYVLENNEDLMSSLIIYKISENVLGIGSIATTSTQRRRGYATRLINDVIHNLESKDPKIFFLYSDINHNFYKRFGFEELPDIFQNHNPSVCMVRPANSIDLINESSLSIPSYF